MVSAPLRELIDLENRSRAESAVDGFPKAIKVDPAMLTVLKKQNLQLDDRVPIGQVVTLQTVISLRLGGTRVIVTDRVHAANREMAETIARCFRLETVGVDFLSVDITKSWRDVKCAVIEVNSSPMFAFPDVQARFLLERTFLDTGTGRIPSAIVVCADSALRSKVVPIFQRKGLVAGFVEPTSSLLGFEPREMEQVRLADRVQALLLDPACEALVVACTPEEIANQGLPLDRFDLCVIEPGLKSWKPLRGLLERCSDQIIENTPTEIALTRWLEDVA
jgi:hypothetical protein